MYTLVYKTGAWINMGLAIEILYLLKCTAGLGLISHYRAVNGYPGTRVPVGNRTTRVMKMLPGYPFKALNNPISS